MARWNILDDAHGRASIEHAMLLRDHEAAKAMVVKTSSRAEVGMTAEARAAAGKHLPAVNADLSLIHI